MPLRHIRGFRCRAALALLVTPLLLPLPAAGQSSSIDSPCFDPQQPGVDLCQCRWDAGPRGAKGVLGGTAAGLYASTLAVASDCFNTLIKKSGEWGYLAGKYAVLSATGFPPVTGLATIALGGQISSDLSKNAVRCAVRGLVRGFGKAGAGYSDRSTEAAIAVVNAMFEATDAKNFFLDLDRFSGQVGRYGNLENWPASEQQSFWKWFNKAELTFKNRFYGGLPKYVKALSPSDFYEGGESTDFRRPDPASLRAASRHEAALGVVDEAIDSCKVETGNLGLDAANTAVQEDLKRLRHDEALYREKHRNCAWRAEDWDRKGAPVGYGRTMRVGDNPYSELEAYYAELTRQAEHSIALMESLPPQLAARRKTLAQRAQELRDAKRRLDGEVAPALDSVVDALGAHDRCDYRSARQTWMAELAPILTSSSVPGTAEDAGALRFRDACLDHASRSDGGLDWSDLTDAAATLEALRSAEAQLRAPYDSAVSALDGGQTCRALVSRATRLAGVLPSSYVQGCLAADLPRLAEIEAAAQGVRDHWAAQGERVQRARSAAATCDTAGVGEALGPLCAATADLPCQDGDLQIILAAAPASCALAELTVREACQGAIASLPSIAPVSAAPAKRGCDGLATYFDRAVGLEEAEGLVEASRDCDRKSAPDAYLRWCSSGTNQIGRLPWSCYEGIPPHAIADRLQSFYTRLAAACQKAQAAGKTCSNVISVLLPYPPGTKEADRPRPPPLPN